MSSAVGPVSGSAKIGRLSFAMLVVLAAFVTVLPAALDVLAVPFIVFTMALVLSEMGARGLELRRRWPLLIADLQAGLVLVLVALVAAGYGGGSSPHWAVAALVLVGAGTWLPTRHALLLTALALMMLAVVHIGRDLSGFRGAYLIFWVTCFIAASAVGHLAARDELEEALEPIVDPLTGLDTEPMLRRVIEREHHEALRYGRPYSVMLVRLADSKGLIRRFGDGARRRVLQVLGQTLSQLVRESDALGRWGEDGFAVLLVEADREHAGIAARRITSVLAKLSVELEEDRSAKPEIIASFASHPSDGHTVNEVIARIGQDPFRTRNGGDS